MLPSRRSHPLDLTVTFLLLALLAPSGTHAAPNPVVSPAAVAEAEALAARAKERFKAKDFERSAKMFMMAYALTHEPALVYNAARAYEEAGMAGDAAGLFKLYISLTDDADGILEARERIRRLEGKTPTIPVPTPVSPPAPLPTVAPPVVTPPAVAPVAPANAPPPPELASPPAPVPQVLPSAPKPTASAPPAAPSVVSPAARTPVVTVTSEAPPAWPRWSTAGTAGLAVVAGVALMLSGQTAAEEANSTLAANQPAYTAAYDRAETRWWAGAALTGVGVGLAGLSTWLWLREGPTQVTVVPSTQGLAVAGRF